MSIVDNIRVKQSFDPDGKKGGYSFEKDVSNEKSVLVDSGLDEPAWQGYYNNSWTRIVRKSRCGGHDIVDWRNDDEN